MAVEQKNYIFISGTSSGIGNATMKLLAKKGYIVFSGVRTSEDAERLRRLSKNIIPVFVDITKPEQINTAVKTISPYIADDDSFSLINNAGIIVPGPIEILPNPEKRETYVQILISEIPEAGLSVDVQGVVGDIDQVLVDQFVEALIKALCTTEFVV